MPLWQKIHHAPDFGIFGTMSSNCYLFGVLVLIELGANDFGAEGVPLVGVEHFAGP